jgi:hypothetical protein
MNSQIFLLSFFSLAHKMPKDAFSLYTLISYKKILVFIWLAGENVILNREIEIAKTLWSPGIYHRALDCFQTLKLKSGGLISRMTGLEDGGDVW